MITRRALTVAGVDPTGGAGILADVAVFRAFGCRPTAVVAALTAQGSCGVRAARAVDAAFVVEQLEALLADGSPTAAKTGMLPTASIVRAVAAAFAGRADAYLVVDPVLVSGDGTPLVDDDVARALVEHLAPRADLVTPNAPEASALAGVPVVDVESAVCAARRLQSLGARAVLVKGGHLVGDAAVDVLVDGPGEPLVVTRPRLATTRRVHGTGCALSAAVAAGLACGLDLRTAVVVAADYVHAAIARAYAAGDGALFLDFSVRVPGMPT